MKKLFAGLILIMLNMQITVGPVIIGLLPSFVGYVLIYKGLLELRDDAESFRKAIRPGLYAAVPALGVYLLDLLGGASVNGLGILLQILELVLRTILLYRLCRGIGELETANGLSLRSRALHLLWLCMTTMSGAAWVCSLFSNLGDIFAMIASVAAFVFLVLFYASMMDYKDAMEEAQAQ